MSENNEISVAIAPGELLDKISILEIKNERIKDPAKLQNIRTELAILQKISTQAIPQNQQISQLFQDLKKINETLWVIEDDIRDCERDKDFGPKFIELARSVYITNDERARIKKEINQ